MKNILPATFLATFLLAGTFAAGAAEKATEKPNEQIISLAVTEKGFVPDQIKVKPGTHLILKVTRKTDATCATQIKISEKKIKKDLPLNTEVVVDVGTLQKGKVTFACGMDMVTGFIKVE